MSIRLARFEMPNRLVKNEVTANDNYAQFVAEPFDRGYGHTIGNSLRRVLLSSLEGASITSVRIKGAEHEFSTLPGVLEDVTQIVLNLKKVKFQHFDNKDIHVLSINADKEGVVTAGDIRDDQHYQVINKDQIICTLDRKGKFEADIEVRVGRGFATGEENKRPDMPIGVIPIDAIFSPVTRVKYAVEATRVGQNTDYDKLVLDVWTDGRIAPQDALLQASAILRRHLDVFVNYDDSQVEFDAAPEAQSEENLELRKLLNMSVNEIELSVRAANCLNNANITSVGQLALKSEAEMLRYRNFGKKSLTEIKEKLQELGLNLGMKLDASLLEPLPGGVSMLRSGFRREDDDEGDADSFSRLISANLGDDDDDEDDEVEVEEEEEA
ncbi:DNA-directed RNA polymerase subunit alpha [Phragmitibacter flavus]|uniref:DNA-directed RNA polymerase subunit alpha n=1 Tax=Phragmitibacter flavus TaxID=2576071 RepID=A0A5R8KCG9_9BACT|nr:DNA-directed RNA polymerase subunit alpha [Phragmitibacter flavus]TLD69998.1 DNA-directed RNA polymerase subunit alpha [Phragmitibacter flavus]